MLENHPESLGKLSKARAISMLSQASIMLREIAEPRPIGDTIKSAITRAARAVSAHASEPMTYARAENVWRGEARRIDAAEMDAIRAAHEARQRTLRSEIQQAQALASQLEGLAASIVAPSAGTPDGEIRAASVDLRRAADEARKVAHTLRRLAAEDRGI